MRKLLVAFLFSIILTTSFVSCSTESPKPPVQAEDGVSSGEGFTVESNIASISSWNEKSISRAVAGDPLVGVLLVFDEEDTFRIEFITGELRYNGDGMAYNYVLHVPRMIAEIYKEGGGHNPESGNPFWWYMSVYFDLSMQEFKDSYYSALNLLIGKVGEMLPLPEIEKVKDNWTSSYEDDLEIVKPENIEDRTLVLIDPDPSTELKGTSITHQNDGPFTQGEGYGDIIDRAFYISPEGTLYYPMALADVYAEYKGEYKLNGNQLWMYSETYFGISLSDVKINGIGMLIEKLREQKGNLPYPTVEDYRNHEANPEEDDLSMFENYFDKKYDHLAVEQTVEITDDFISERKFDSQLTGDLIGEKDNYEKCWMTFSIVDDNGPKIYYPVVLDYLYMEYSEKNHTSGDALWFYLECYFSDYELTSKKLEEKGLGILMKFLIEKGEKGELPFPSLGDYEERLGKY